MQGDAPAFSAFADPEVELRGVRGWLALMIFGMALTSCANLFDAVQILAAPRSLYILVLLITAVEAAISAFGLFTCVLLLRQKPYAPAVAVAWFLALGAVFLSGAGFGYMFTGQLRAAWFRGFIYVAVWLAYLARSRRVRVTYRRVRQVSPRPDTAAFD
jgi:hypothetical protein